MPGWWNWQTCLPAGRHARLYIKNMYYVYVIDSIRKKYIYVGITNNIERRVSQHNKGQSRTTKPYKPFRLIYQEGLATRKEARKTEKYLKSGCGKEFLRQLK